jgi:hypothetical protein
MRQRAATEKRSRKEERRLQRRAEKRNARGRLSPIAAEIARCDAIAGHPTTRAERDRLRQEEVAELRDFIAEGRTESERLARARKGEVEPALSGSVGVAASRSPDLG